MLSYLYMLKCDKPGPCSAEVVWYVRTMHAIALAPAHSLEHVILTAHSHTYAHVRIFTSTTSYRVATLCLTTLLCAYAYRKINSEFTQDKQNVWCLCKRAKRKDTYACTYVGEKKTAQAIQKWGKKAKKPRLFFVIGLPIRYGVMKQRKEIKILTYRKQWWNG